MPFDRTPATTLPRPLGALEKLFWLADQNRPVHFAIAAEVEGPRGLTSGRRRSIASVGSRR